MGLHPTYDSETANTAKIQKIRYYYGFLSLLALLTGIVIYLLFRDVSSFLLFEWIKKPAFIGSTLIELKPSVFFNILKFNVPDMLWFLSGILLLRFIWFDNQKIQNTYIFCFYGFAAIFETSQLFQNIPGTFDVFDLLFMGIVAFVEGLLYIKFTRRRKA
jgi:hypothetical protein